MQLPRPRRRDRAGGAARQRQHDSQDAHRKFIADTSLNSRWCRIATRRSLQGLRRRAPRRLVSAEARDLRHRPRGRRAPRDPERVRDREAHRRGARDAARAAVLASTPNPRAATPRSRRSPSAIRPACSPRRTSCGTSGAGSSASRRRGWVGERSFRPRGSRTSPRSAVRSPAVEPASRIVPIMTKAAMRARLRRRRPRCRAERADRHRREPDGGRERRPGSPR